MMGRYIARRLIQLIPLVIGITMVTFLLANLAPGEPSSCAVCKGDVLWEWAWMREQVEMAFSSALRSPGSDVEPRASR